MSARDDVHLTDEQLDDYADGELNAAARASADAHLATCARCRYALDETRALLVTATRERASVTAPAELWPLVATSTIHLATMRRHVLASLRGVLIAGAIALVAATAVVTWKVARWTAPSSSVAPRAVVPPGSHAGHPTGGRPVAPRPRPAPIAPEAPEPPRP